MKRIFLHFLILFILGVGFSQGADCALVVQGRDLESFFQEGNKAAWRDASHITIEELSIPENFEKSLNILKMNRKLKHLGLIKFGMNHWRALYLEKFLGDSTITSLKIKEKSSHGVLESDGVLQVLKNHPTITSLNIHITDGFFHKVMGAAEESKGIGADALAAILEENKVLRFLKLNGKIKEDDVDQLLKAIEGNKTLQSLKLHNNSLTYEQIDHLLKILPASLTSLDLKGDQLDFGKIEEEAKEKKSVTLFQPIKESTLKSLKLRRFGPAVIDTLGPYKSPNAISPLCFLTSLDLGGNNLRDEGIKKLSMLFSETSGQPITLQKLNLYDNKIGFGAGADLCEILGFSPNLLYLGLGKNDLGDKGVENLANRLIKGSSITSLDVSNNNLSEGGIEAITNALKNNHTIEKLDISGCKMKTAFLNPGKSMNGLKHLTISNMELGNGGVTFINFLRGKDLSLTHLTAIGNEPTFSNEILKHIKENKTIKELVIGCKGTKESSELERKALKMFRQHSSLCVLKTEIEMEDDSKQEKVSGIKDKNYFPRFRISLGNYTRPLFSTFKSIGKKIYFSFNPYYWSWKKLFRWKS